YNHKRIKMKLGGVSPVAYRSLLATAQLSHRPTFGGHFKADRSRFVEQGFRIGMKIQRMSDESRGECTPERGLRAFLFARQFDGSKRRAFNHRAHCR
ncbi:hypothetical protein, partial [Caballeronia sp. GAFFF2]|uniref:hypothetical protein n=1 Tax=Caballeronia sp. GAFFF2 TaxID=2921741 RepID=UPI002027C473